MTEERRRVTLSKADRETPAGRQLMPLLAELCSDGMVSRNEMTRLRAWLEIDHGVDFPALPFLHETIEQISSDGEVTEDELDLLALARASANVRSRPPHVPLVTRPVNVSGFF